MIGCIEHDLKISSKDIESEKELAMFKAGLAYLEKQKEQKPLPGFDELTPNEKMNHPLYREGFVAGQKEAEQRPAEWSENFEENIGRLLGDKLTWHSEDGSMSSSVLIDDRTLKDICAGIWFYVGKEALKYPNKELNVSEWSEEDERVRKEIIKYFENEKRNTIRTVGDLDILNRWIAHLEKQKEQNLEDIEDETVRRYMKLDKFTLANMLAERDKTNAEIIESIESIEEQSAEWSEDEERLDSIIESYKVLLKDYKACHDVDFIPYNSNTLIRNVVDDINFLKSLLSRPKSSDNWKPSEEQMKAMEEVRTIFHNHHLWDEINPILYDYEELMRDLQKLI